MYSSSSPPLTNATSGDDHRNLCWSTDAQAIDGQLVLVDVVLLLKDEVQVPDLDAAIDGAGEDGVLSGRHQGLDLNDPLNERDLCKMKFLLCLLKNHFSL